MKICIRCNKHEAIQDNYYCENCKKEIKRIDEILEIKEEKGDGKE